MLEITNLHAKVDKKIILTGVDLKVKPGEFHIILGPNGSGKSTLGKILLGHPRYEVMSGNISFDGEDLMEIDTYQRAKKGIFLSHQHPASIEGVSYFELLRASQKETGERMSLFKFKKLVKDIFRRCHIKEEFIDRDFNAGASGGEMKKIEIASLLALSPRLAFLDEIDSGLDFDAHKVVIEGINEFMKNKSNSLILVTHSKEILNYLQPDKVHLFCDGVVVKTGGKNLIDEIHKKGYTGIIQEEKCSSCSVKDTCNHI